MGKKVENISDLGNGHFRYLFINKIMFVGNNKEETHSSILTQSGEKYEKIQVAGSYTSTTIGNKVLINGDGSSGLGIDTRDPKQVAKFVRNLPDIGQRIVETI